MSGSEAARLAAFHAAAVIESALANGWETLDRYGPDRPRVETALNQLCTELEHRARPRRDARAPLSEAVPDASSPGGRDEKPVPVAESVTDTGAGDGSQDDTARQRLEEERRWRRALKPIPADVAGAEGYQGAVWPDGWGRYHVVAPDGERIGYAEQGGGVRTRSWGAHAPEGRRLGLAGMPTRARVVADLVRRHREHTPHTDHAVDGLPDGWRLTQTQAEHDDGRWRLIAPGGEVAGTLAREAYGGRRAEWRATAGDPARGTVLRTTVTPDSDDPACGSDFDLFRTRRAAARALAAWHDLDLYDQ